MRILAGFALYALATGLAIGADWDGAYVGGNVGLSASKLTVNQSIRGPFFGPNGCTVGGTPPFCTSVQAFVPSSVSDLKRNSLTGGVQAGYNWRYGRALFGLEADANSLSINRSSSSGATLPGTGGGAIPTITASGSAQSAWVATLRPRLGFIATDKTMVYVTAGLAFSDQRFSGQDTVTAVGGPAGAGLVLANFAPSASKTTGTVIGAGLEYAISDRMSLKAEYQHLSFGNPTAAAGSQGSGFVFAGSTFTANTNTKVDVVRVGVNWALGARSPNSMERSRSRDFGDRPFEGLYYGLSAGLADSKTSVSRTLTYRPGVTGGTPANLAIQANAIGAPVSISKDGFTGGVQAGYNWRSGDVVFGVELDANYLAMNRANTSVSRLVANATKTFTVTDTERSSWVATLRPRIGFMPTEKSLVYVTAGVALSDQKYAYNVSVFSTVGGGGFLGLYDSAASKAIGSVVGGGYEFAWSKNTTLRAEYQHLEFRNPQATAGNATGFNLGSDLTGSQITANAKVKTDLLRIGMNWKF